MSGWFRSEELVPVEGIECRCPGTPHADGDTFWLRTALTPQGALEAVQSVRDLDDAALIEARLGWVYVLNGVAQWTLVDDKGRPVPCTRENVGRLDWEAVYPVAQRASQLGYSEDLVRPLAERQSKSSRNGLTAVSTSAGTGSSKQHRKR